MNLSTEMYPHYYPIIFEFEKDFDWWWWKIWFNNYWWVCFVFTFIYVVSIFSIREFMRNRPAYELHYEMLAWNMTLATFSVVCATRLWPELASTLWHHGFYGTLCDGSFVEINKVTQFWAWLFNWSKVMEFGDTLFIVLRKRKLMFLHWYHHITVCCYGNFAYAEWAQPAMRWFMAINCLVHCFMYIYYTLKILKWHVPRWISMSLTLTQISQMVVGIVISYATIRLKIRNDPCVVGLKSTFVLIFLFFTYFLLFCHYFYKAYMRTPELKKAAHTPKDTQKDESQMLVGEEKTPGTRKRFINTLMDTTESAFNPTHGQ